MCCRASTKAINAAKTVAPTIHLRERLRQRSHPSMTNRTSSNHTFGNNDGSPRGAVNKRYAAMKNARCHGSDSSDRSTSGSNSKINVYDAAFVDNKSTAMTNQAKSRRSVDGFRATPRQRKTITVTLIKVRKKKNIRGASQSGLGFSSGSRTR